MEINDNSKETLNNEKDFEENHTEEKDMSEIELEQTEKEITEQIAQGSESNDTSIDENEISMEELLKAEDNLSEKLYKNELVYVKVVAVNNEFVYVDIGEKNEGIIPIKDFEGFKLPNVGTKIIAVLERKGSGERNTVLSYRKAKEAVTLKWLEKAFQEKQRIKGRIAQQIKGGYIVSINGANAFMPLSLSELGGAPRHYLPVNAKVKFYLIDFDPKNKKIIVSRRAVLEEDEKARREKILSETNEGDYTRVVVAKIIDSGMFVRYQGMEGFVKLEDVDWKNPKQALSEYKRGQRIKVKILSIDREKQRINFGIKQTKPNPIDILRRKFPVRSSVKGKVVEIGDKWVKLHIAEDIYGIINEEDYSYEGAPEKDSVVDAAVVGVNPETYELKLSIKRYEQIENRKRIEQYSKQSPKITLGQLLKDSENN
ncbi:MAG: S1 RNA-binding domain-containing protein [Elusimicrobiales bacterium]|nr:S1 RNA-binding domain-containing protein [Elusimicrobiales bacterium]